MRKRTHELRKDERAVPEDRGEALDSDDGTPEPEGPGESGDEDASASERGDSEDEVRPSA